VKLVQAPNVAIGLLVVGWLSGTYGVLSQLGDPAPWVSRADLEAHRHISVSFMFLGLAALLASVWLSGYSFATAPKRATLAFLGCAIPTVLLCIAAWR
jgi:hypothetical protein